MAAHLSTYFPFHRFDRDFHSDVVVFLGECGFPDSQQVAGVVGEFIDDVLFRVVNPPALPFISFHHLEHSFAVRLLQPVNSLLEALNFQNLPVNFQ